MGAHHRRARSDSAVVAKWAQTVRTLGARASASTAPPDPDGQASGVLPVHVSLAQKRWLLPAAIGVLVAGLLTGGVMAAFALPSGDITTASNAAPPLPGDITDPTLRPTQSPTADPTPTATPTPAPTPTAAATTRPVQLVPPVGTLRTASSQCLTVDGNNDGARIHAAACDGSGPQRWLLSPLNADTYLIVDATNGKCVDVSDVSKDDGAQIHLWTCLMAPNQQWKVTRRGDSLALVSVNSGKCAAVEGDGGTKQRNCRDDASQRWTVQAG